MSDQNKRKKPAASFGTWLMQDLGDIGTTFAKGDWKTRVSYLVMGFGQLMRGQIVRGVSFLASEVLFILYLVFFGWKYLSKITTLGTSGRGFNPDGTVTYGDNSFFILLFGILTVIAVLAILYLWRVNLRQNRDAERLLAAGKKLPTNLHDLGSLLDENFDKTLLAFPVLGIFAFTVLPIIFMIAIAFTNYDAKHQPPSQLFTWVGLENFKSLFSFGGGQTNFGSTFFSVLGWTLVWAFFATFLNYFLGMGVAILINRKGIRFKKMWRTIFVMTIAVPQFVSLLYVGKMFARDGVINGLLLDAGLISSAIGFWENAASARILIILINLWIGIPYMMLIATGLLMNIPEDLYESARIDGANAFQMFRKITLPYMLFVTGPFLLTSFTGNLNNFNVIYLLNQGKPQSMELTGGAGYTDLLVTWLYKMTINDTNYKMAAVLGIMVFIVVAGITLSVYNLLPSVKDEEGFQ